jgi:2-phosphosulfolactate phosphatase
MKFQRVTLDTCASATGVVVVVDVIRAFTTAAYALAAGAREIILTREVDEALALRRRIPGALVMGEVAGMPVAGFDFGNSPSRLAGLDLTGRTLIQRTSAGTQGVVLSSQAKNLFACSFVCAGATAALIRRMAPQKVTFVITGIDPTSQYNGRPYQDGDEDVACADYLEVLLGGESLDAAPFIHRVRESPAGRTLADSEQPENPAADLGYCTALDAFDFAMRVNRQDGLLVMERIEVMPPA